MTQEQPRGLVAEWLADSASAVDWRKVQDGYLAKLAAIRALEPNPHYQFTPADIALAFMTGYVRAKETRNDDGDPTREFSNRLESTGDSNPETPGENQAGPEEQQDRQDQPADEVHHCPDGYEPAG